MLSQRALDLQTQTSSIMNGHLLCATDPFSSTNQNGYLNFGIAENHLMNDWMLPYVNGQISIQAEDLQYFDLSGLKELKIAAKSFFSRHMGLNSLQPDNFVFMNGLSSVCECLSFSLFNSGDYMMIASPYYTGFEFDFQKRFGVNFLKVPLKIEADFQHQIEPFIEVYENFVDKHKIKAVIITHPHNPTGEIISLDFLKSIVEFARQRNLEIIADEIYALTNMSGEKFVSLLTLAGDYSHHVHWLYGLAKDFTLAGFKVGIFYSSNSQIVESMKLLSYFHCISSLNQRFCQKLFLDTKFVMDFITENNRRLKTTKSILLEALPKMRYYSGGSGLFFLIDLSPFLEDLTFSSEKILTQKLLSKYRIFFTPGKDLGMSRPGFYRLCFARDEKSIEELINRLQKFYTSEKIYRRI